MVAVGITVWGLVDATGAAGVAVTAAAGTAGVADLTATGPGADGAVGVGTA